MVCACGSRPCLNCETHVDRSQSRDEIALGYEASRASDLVPISLHRNFDLRASERCDARSDPTREKRVDVDASHREGLPTVINDLYLESRM
jgi:hypothetical protein